MSDVDGKSLVEGGPWWVPHQRHETWNIVLEWCECSSHRTDSKVLTQRLFWVQRKNFFNFSLNIGRHDKNTWQHEWTGQTHDVIVDNAFFWKTQRSCMTHESGSSWRSAKYPIDWHDMQTSAMFNSNNKLLPFICKTIPFPFSPSWSMSASFQFYEFKEGNKHSI